MRTGGLQFCPALSASFVAKHFQWNAWEHLIEHSGITIDRPYRTAHPVFPNIIYPMQYGYINDTTSSDGHEIDVFVGKASCGLVGLLMTTDIRRQDCEMKLLYRCSPEEIYLAHGFINFDQQHMVGVLVMRYPMHSL